MYFRQARTGKLSRASLGLPCPAWKLHLDHRPISPFQITRITANRTTRNMPKLSMKVETNRSIDLPNRATEVVTSTEVRTIEVFLVYMIPHLSFESPPLSFISFWMENRDWNSFMYDVDCKYFEFPALTAHFRQLNLAEDDFKLKSILIIKKIRKCQDVNAVSPFAK